MQNICGVDIAKDRLDAFAEPNHHRRFATDPEGIAALAGFGALAASLAEPVAADPVWRDLDAAFRSVKGVADRTVAPCSPTSPKSALSDKQIARLAGLAPLADDSSKRHGQRRTPAAVAPASAGCSSWVPISPANPTQPSPTSVSACSIGANPRWSCASPWPANASSASTPTPAMSVGTSPHQLDKPDSRSPLEGGEGGGTPNSA